MLEEKEALCEDNLAAKEENKAILRGSTALIRARILHPEGILEGEKERAPKRNRTTWVDLISKEGGMDELQGGEVCLASLGLNPTSLDPNLDPNLRPDP